MPPPILISLKAALAEHVRFTAAAALTTNLRTAVEQALEAPLPAPDANPVALSRRSQRGRRYEVMHLDIGTTHVGDELLLFLFGLVHWSRQAPEGELAQRPDKFLRRIGRAVDSPFAVSLEVRFQYPAGDYRPIFPLPIELPAQMAGSDFDEIRGLRLVKRGSGQLPYLHQVILDSPDPAHYDVVVLADTTDIRLTSSLFIDVLRHGQQIAAQVVEPIGKQLHDVATAHKED